MNVTKRHMTAAIIFVALFFGPLGLIPIFPEIQAIQLLARSSIAFLGLFVCALIATALIDRVLYGRHRGRIE